MNDYRNEQLTTLNAVLAHLADIPEAERRRLQDLATDYLDFRRRTADFLQSHFGGICRRECYESRRSACCSKDGIITFFADVVVNALLSDAREMEALIQVLKAPHTDFKCVYLGRQGCLWRLKPIVCEMFLCDSAKAEAFSRSPGAKEKWRRLRNEKKGFTWPDRPVLFDALERYFIDRGCDSPLMYLHQSPGLLRIKQQAAAKGNIDHER
jgi:hypothetical protein